MFDMITGLIKMFWLYIKLILIAALIAAAFGYYAYTEHRIHALEEQVASLDMELESCEGSRDRYRMTASFKDHECQQLLQYERDKIKLEIDDGEISPDAFDAIRQKDKKKDGSSTK